MIVINLNILISIVTDNYDRIQMSLNYSDSLVQARLLEDTEKQYNSMYGDRGHKQYLFTIQYNDSFDSEEQSAEKEWQGRTKEMMNRIDAGQSNMLKQMKEEI